MDVGMIVVGTKAELLEGLKRHLESIMIFSSGSPLHLLILTDQDSISQVTTFIGKILSRYEAQILFKNYCFRFCSMGVIQSPNWKWRRRRGRAVNIEDILKINPSFVFAMLNYNIVKNYGHDKCAANLFYISPLYSKVFTFICISSNLFMSQALQGLKKIIFLDSSDLDFKDDILNLWQ